MAGKLQEFGIGDEVSLKGLLSMLKSKPDFVAKSKFPLVIDDKTFSFGCPVVKFVHVCEKKTEQKRFYQCSDY